MSKNIEKDPYKDQITFLKLFETFISHHTNARDQFEKRKYATLQNYNAKYALINNFLVSQRLESLPAINFNIDISKKLSEWLSTRKHSKGNYKHNYIARVRETCRRILQYGAANDLISVNSQQHLKFKKEPPSPPPYFTSEQIKALEGYQTNSSRKSSMLTKNIN